MNRLKRFLGKYWFYIVAFLIPWIVMIIHSLVYDTWLTGNGSLLAGDTLVQIVPLFYEFWEKVHSGESLLYTWNIASGCDFHAALGYFMSPFTLLLLLVPKNWIPDAVQFVMILKWSLTAVTMTHFFYHTKYNKLIQQKKLISMFLGLAFCLGSGMIWFITYIQFNDVMICFPLLLLLIEKMVDEKRWKLYYLVLAFCIISNSYITFEVCIFLVIWFIFQFSANTQEKFKKFLIFAGSSVLAALTSVIIVLPSLVVAQERLAVSDPARELRYVNSCLMPFHTFFKQFFLFSKIARPNDIEPNIFISIIVLMLGVSFFFVKIGKKRKLYMMFVSVFLVASFFSGALSIVWHLFKIPNGVYHRFSNIFVFWMLFLALYTIMHIKQINKKHTIFIGGLLLIASVYTFFKIEVYSSFLGYLISFLLIVLYIIIIVLYCKESIKHRDLLVVLVICGLLELIVNSFYSFEFYDSTQEYKDGGQYYTVSSLLKETTLDDGERIAAANPTSNICMLDDKASASGFVSAINGRMMYLYERLGMSYNGQVEYVVRGASPLLNLIFNVRYAITRTDVECSDQKLIATKEEYSLQHIKRLAGLGYMVDESIRYWDVAQDDCFETQNQFLELAVDETAIFTDVEPKIDCYDSYGETLERDEDFAQLGSYVYALDRVTGTKADFMQMDFYVEKDMDLYMYSCADIYFYTAILVDGEVLHLDARTFNQSTFHIGNVKKGQKITVCMIPETGEKGEKEKIFFRFAEYHEEAYAKAYEKLSKNVYQIEQMESDYVKGTIKADEAGIMMTSIQAVDGFTVLVDGKEVPYETIGYALIGVPLEAGEHTVEFKYRTPYIDLARGITAGAIAIFIVLCIIDWKRKKKQSIIEVTEEVESVAIEEATAEEVAVE